jgi:hypothetical protein
MLILILGGLAWLGFGVLRRRMRQRRNGATSD